MRSRVNPIISSRPNANSQPGRGSSAVQAATRQQAAPAVYLPPPPAAPHSAARLKPVMSQASLRHTLSVQTYRPNDASAAWKPGMAPPVYRPMPPNMQLKPAMQPANCAQSQPGILPSAKRSAARPPIYQQSQVILEKPALFSQTIQMTCDECGKKKGHKSGCSRNKHNRGVVAEAKKVVHQENSSWSNLKCYRPGWVRKNAITEERVKEYCGTGGRIRGHCSSTGNKDDGEQDNTKVDLLAFKSWHTTKYGWA